MREPKYENRNLYINSSSYFEFVPEDVWNFHIGDYHILYKWLKDPRGSTLNLERCSALSKSNRGFAENIKLMQEVDKVIGKHAGLPDAFGGNSK